MPLLHNRRVCTMRAGRRVEHSDEVIAAASKGWIYEFTVASQACVHGKRSRAC
jgi:hypothetical protein